MLGPPLYLTLFTVRRKGPTCGFTFGKDRKEWNTYQCPGVLGGHHRNSFCLARPRTDEGQQVLMPGGCRTRKRAQQLMETPENVKYCRQKLTELAAFGGEVPSLLLPLLKKKKKTEACTKYSSFLEVCLRDCFPSHVTQGADRTGSHFAPGAHREQKGAQWLLAAPEEIKKQAAP